MNNVRYNPLAKDLDTIIDNVQPLWNELRDKRIFITGGTGFFGCWFLESLLWANTKLNLNASAVVLTRNKNRFAKKCPHLFNNPSLTFLTGDVRDFEFPDGHFSHIIHAATDTSLLSTPDHSLLLLNGIVEGTKRTLEFANYCKAEKFLLTSSGAVYGKQPEHVSHLNEEHLSHLDILKSNSTYAIGKCFAEHFSCMYANKYNLQVKIARCFSFIGPYLPLNNHYAISNFLSQSLNNKPITIKGDGTAYRSYLYAADLITWLWAILFRGDTLRPYNVGSSQAHTIKEIALTIARHFNSQSNVQIMQPIKENTVPERYIPDITRTGLELNLFPTVGLDDAISATKEWYLARQDLMLIEP